MKFGETRLRRAIGNFFPQHRVEQHKYIAASHRSAIPHSIAMPIHLTATNDQRQVKVYGLHHRQQSTSERETTFTFESLEAKTFLLSFTISFSLFTPCRLNGIEGKEKTTQKEKEKIEKLKEHRSGSEKKAKEIACDVNDERIERYVT